MRPDVLISRPPVREIDPNSSGRALNRLRSPRVATLASAATALAIGLTSSTAEASTDHKDHVPKVTVSSTGPDTPTGVRVKKNQLFSTHYLDGSWTMSEPWVPNIPYTGPDGLQTESGEFDKYKIDPTLPLGMVVAKIDAPGDNDQIIPVGYGGTFRATESGVVYLLPNEQKRYRKDNAGDIIYTKPQVRR